MRASATSATSLGAAQDFIEKRLVGCTFTLFGNQINGKCKSLRFSSQKASPMGAGEWLFSLGW
jgi:hypothetical protein